MRVRLIRGEVIFSPRATYVKDCPIAWTSGLHLRKRSPQEIGDDAFESCTSGLARAFYSSMRMKLLGDVQRESAGGGLAPISI